MQEWNVDFEPRGHRGHPWLRVEAVRASDQRAAIITAALQERINPSNYKARAKLVTPQSPNQAEESVTLQAKADG